MQIEAFLRRAAAAGSLCDAAIARVAAEQFLALVRGEIHLRHLLRLEIQPKPAQLRAAVRASVATFLRAFATKTGD